MWRCDTSLWHGLRVWARRCRCFCDASRFWWTCRVAWRSSLCPWMLKQKLHPPVSQLLCTGTVNGEGLSRARKTVTHTTFDGHIFLQILFRASFGPLPPRYLPGTSQFCPSPGGVTDGFPPGEDSFTVALAHLGCSAPLKLPALYSSSTIRDIFHGLCRASAPLCLSSLGS